MWRAFCSALSVIDRVFDEWLGIAAIAFFVWLGAYQNYQMDFSGGIVCWLVAGGIWWMMRRPPEGAGPGST